MKGVSRYYQPPLLATDPLIKLGEVERVLAKIFKPGPSRPTIVGWIEEGILEGKQFGSGAHWFVYESSLTNFIRAAQEPSQQKLAA